MAIVNLLDKSISVLNDCEHSNVITVLDNGDTGFFRVGNVFTPQHLIGKKLILNFELLED